MGGAVWACARLEIAVRKDSSEAESDEDDLLELDSSEEDVWVPKLLTLLPIIIP